MNASTHPDRPWSKADHAAMGTSIVVGVALFAWGWWSSSGVAEVGETVFGVVLGIAALGAAATGGLAWVASGRRAVRARHHELMRLVDEGVARLPSAHAMAAPDVLVALAGSPRVHRPDCLLVRGKSVISVPTGSQRLRRRVACEMCRP